MFAPTPTSSFCCNCGPSASSASSASELAAALQDARSIASSMGGNLPPSANASPSFQKEQIVSILQSALDLIDGVENEEDDDGLRLGL